MGCLDEGTTLTAVRRLADYLRQNIMELAHSLLLNEEALMKLSDNKRPVFVFEWLRFLDKVLQAANKSDIKEKQEKLVSQLLAQMQRAPGPPTRKLLARCLATLFSVGDTLSLYGAINACNDIVRSKDDSPSYLPTRLTAIACLGGMYERLGRMMGRSFEDTVVLLVKAMRAAESQGRCEILSTLEKMVIGLGAGGASAHRDIYKVCKNAMTDRAMAVRSASAKCLLALVQYASFVHTNELESTVSLCLRSLDGSNYEVRCDVGKMLGSLLARTQQQPAGPPPPANQQGKSKKAVTLEEALNFLAAGFLKSGSNFILKGPTADMIKGGASINREVRVGVTHAYVEFAQAMGGLWLERHLSVFLHHVLLLVASPKATPTHVDAVYARKCVQFILRQLFRSMLSEKAQRAAAKEIASLVVRAMNSVAINSSGGRDDGGSAGSGGGTQGGSGTAAGDETMGSSPATLAAGAENNQHVLICALLELAELAQSLDTAAAPLLEPPFSVSDALLSVLLHPSSATSLAGAYALRSLSVALPSRLTPLLELCEQKLQQLKGSPEAVSGYSYAVAALLAGVRQGTLGIPQAKGRQVFQLAEEMLRAANQNSRMSLPRTQAGWFLLGAWMTLGPAAVKAYMPRMVLMWKNAFPRSSKELEAEKTRGDAFTWQVTLEARAGALCAMQSFLEHCSELLTEEIIRRLLPPIESALALLGAMPAIIRAFGPHLKASAAMLRLRLYHVLLRLPPATFEGAYTALLRELVAEFTLTENPANTTTSMLRALCHADDSVILGSWLQVTDHKAIEDQLQPNSASGSGTLEHDASCLFLRDQNDDGRGGPAVHIPGPLPLGVAVIDASVQLFGAIFSRVQHKHRLQMLEHFAECIRQAKSARQQAVQMNIFTAVLCAMKSLADAKQAFGDSALRKAAVQLILGALSSGNPILRCAGGECLGRMAQVTGESRFIAEMVQHSFDRLRTARDVVTRTGHSLALGCLHRYVGGLNSGQHLDTSVGILLALAQDTTSPIVQVWSLHALALIAEIGGPMFRKFVEPSLSLVLQLLLSVPPSHTDVHQCLGKVLGALITTLGPELQVNISAIATARLSCLVCCAVMQDHPDSLVQAEAISCLQQLHMFAPRHVNLSTLVPHLCSCLSSRHLLLRRAAVSCLRQLAHREAAEVCDIATQFALQHSESGGTASMVPGGRRVGASLAHLSERGVEGALFALLDTEADAVLRRDVHDTLQSLLQTLGIAQLARWLALLKEVLQAGRSAAADDGNDFGGSGVFDRETTGDDEEDDNADQQFRANKEEDNTHPQVSPRWPTRVFAIDCLRHLMEACSAAASLLTPHLDLTAAKRESAATGRSDFLVLHLSDIVRMAFMAATSDSDRLRLVGLAALQDVIHNFARVAEPEFPGHVILEQYQAQVGAALRPAFATDTASDVTAAACEVCSTWIGSGVARDLNDLRRVHQLLVSSLSKLRTGRNQQAGHLYSEAASTMENLVVLRAWAEVYIVAMKRSGHGSSGMEEMEEHSDQESIKSSNSGLDSTGSEDLLSFVRPELLRLTSHWLSALKDHALLSLPSELASQLPAEGGTFYNAECADSSREHYRRNWPAILHATALWLREEGFDDIPVNMNAEAINTERFHLLLGICVEAICSLVSKQPLEVIDVCLESISVLLCKRWSRSALTKDDCLAIELLHVLHRVFLTRDSLATHMKCVQVVNRIILARREKLDKERENFVKEREDDSPVSELPSQVANLGEGGVSGKIDRANSVTYAALEVLLCGLLRYCPRLLHDASKDGDAFTPPLPPASAREQAESGALLGAILASLAPILGLASPTGQVTLLPSALQLMLRTIKCSLARNDDVLASVLRSVVACLHSVLTLWPQLASCPKQSNAASSLASHLASLLHRLLTQAASDAQPSDSALLLATSVALLTYRHCPPALLHSAPLRAALLQAFVAVWSPEVAPSPRRRQQCVQALRRLSQHPDSAVASLCVRSLLPLLLRWLYSLPGAQEVTTEQLPLVKDCVMLVEALVAGMASPAHRTSLLLLCVPLLVALLTHDALQQWALDRLKAIGPAYPEEFRSIMNSAAELKPRLEAALKASAVAGKGSDSQMKRAEPVVVQQPVKPSIQLKTDFSNFK